MIIFGISCPHLYITTQPVAEVLEYISCKVVGTSSYTACMGKRLTQQLLATGGQGSKNTTPCTVNWVQKVASGVPELIEPTDELAGRGCCCLMLR